jgi:hypothetical protein
MVEPRRLCVLLEIETSRPELSEERMAALAHATEAERLAVRLAVLTAINTAELKAVVAVLPKEMTMMMMRAMREAAPESVVVPPTGPGYCP